VAAVTNMQTQQTLQLSCYNCDTVLLFNINVIVDCLTSKQLHVSVCYGIVNIGFSNSVYYFRKRPVHVVSGESNGGPSQLKLMSHLTTLNDGAV